MAISGITSAISGSKNPPRAIAARQGGGFQQAFLQKVDALLDQLRGPRTELRQQVAQAGGTPPKPVQQQVNLLAQRLADLGAQREQTLQTQSDVQSNIKNIQDFLSRPATPAPIRTAGQQQLPAGQSAAAEEGLPGDAANLAASEDALVGTEEASNRADPPRLLPVAAKGFVAGRQTALESARVQVLQAFESLSTKDLGGDDAEGGESTSEVVADLGGDQPADYQSGLRTAARAYQATLEAASIDLRNRLSEIDNRIDATQQELQALSAPSGVSGGRRRSGPPVVSPAQLDQQALEMFTQARSINGGIVESRRVPVKTMVYAMQSMVTFQPRGRVVSISA